MQVEEMQMIGKYLNLCLTSPVIREVHTQMVYYFQGSDWQ